MTKLSVNMKKQFFLVVALILMFISKGSFAQQAGNNLVTGNFNEVTFPEFFQKIEKQTLFHFYYDPAQFDTITITINVSNAHLPSVLDKVFSNTDWHYIIDNENQVFITKGFTC